MLRPSGITLEQTGTTYQLTVHRKDTPFVARMILGVLCLVSGLLPAYMIMLVVQDGKGIPLGAVIGSLVCLFVAAFFLQLLLWNAYGKECITITEHEVNYWCDYRFFKNRKLRLEGPYFEYLVQASSQPSSREDVLDGEELTEGDGHLVIRNASSEIISQIPVSVELLHETLMVLLMEEVE